jgi:hypothetical protein
LIAGKGVAELRNRDGFLTPEIQLRSFNENGWVSVDNSVV